MKKRRILACALSLSMVVSSFSYHAFAQENTVADTDAIAEVSENADEVVSSSSAGVVVETETTDEAKTEELALDSWVGGNTSTAVITSQTVEPGENSVHLAVPAGKGKVSSSEDSIVYYTTEIDSAYDFTLSGKITVNSVNGSASNPQQSGYGIAVLNNLYDKADGSGVFTSGAFGTFAMEDSKATTGMFGLRCRTGEGGTKVPSYKAADGEFNSLAGVKSSGGGDVIDVELNKTGNLVTLTVDGKSESHLFTDVELNGTIYPMFFVARDADITVSDIVYKHDEKKVTGVKVTKLPDNTTYLVNQEPDFTGMVVEATYEDGTTAVVDDYKVTGYDVTSATTQTLTVLKGSSTTTFDVNFKPIDLTKVTVVSAPYDPVFHAGVPFSAQGINVKADFEDGSSVTYKDAENLVISVNGIELKDGEAIDPAILALNKEVDVKVTLIESENYNSLPTSYGTFKATASNEALQALNVAYMPAKTAYFVGDEEDLEGLTIVAKFADGYTEILAEDAYTVTGFDSKTAGVKTITVTSVFNPSVTVTYEVTVSEKRAKEMKISVYPQTTYSVGEAWNPDGMKVVTVYNNADEVECVLSKDYTIDTSKFSTAAVGETQITIVPANNAFAPIVLPITVREKQEVYWNSLVFGASSGGVNSGDPSSSVTKDPETGAMHIQSWFGSGKITGDHDGIAYYYTRVNPDDNFELTGDVYVAAYLGVPPGDNGSPGAYNVDSKRNGQEAFGLMARDVIPLKAEEGKGINDKGTMTIYSADAVKDANGEPVGLKSGDDFTSNIAIAGGYAGTSWPADPTASSYYKNSNINRINLYARVGSDHFKDGKGTKLGPKAVSSAFPQAAIHYDSTSLKMTGAKSDYSQKGDKYRITLARVNVQSDPATGAITRRGLKVTSTYLDGVDESRIGETMTTYMSDEEVNNMFAVQNDKDAYVGFFAARWAIIDVDNIQFKTSTPATDPVYNVVEEEAVNPNVSVGSSLYTTDTNYTLVLKANNENGGFLTLKKGDEVLYRQLQIGKKKVRVNLTLDADSANTYTAIYTPSKLDYLTSYNDVVSTFTVYHRSLSDSDTIYVGPNGKSEAYVDADGVSHAAGSAREYPMDIKSALGFIKPSQTIVVLDGTYKLEERLYVGLENAGVKGKVKSIIADEGAHPVIDFQSKGTGFYVAGDYWHVSGLEIIGSADQQPGFELGGRNCTVENVKTHDNGGTGFQVSRVSADQAYFEDWPANNIIRHCESWNNADSSKINADGFGCKLTVGNGNVFDNCVSHHNADDGWDLYTKIASGPIGETVLFNCATYKQGYFINEKGTDSAWGAGGHNGLKMGGENIAVPHYLKDCKSFLNEKSGSGISSNSNPQMKIRNAVVYKNESAGVSLYSGGAQSKYMYDLKGVVSFGNNGKDQIGGSLNKDTDFVNHAVTDPLSAEANNLLQRDGKATVDAAGNTVDAASLFVSTDFDACTTNNRFEQNPDGSFNFKGYLERKEAYVHDEADAVVMKGCFYEEETEATTKTETTESTTKTPSKPGSSGGSSSSSSSSSKSSGGSSSSRASGTVKPSNDKRAVKNDKIKVDTPDDTKIIPPVNATAFTDISARPWAVEAITALSEAGVINGVGNGKFAPDAPAKRCDFIVMLTKLLGIEGTATDNFDDVPSGAYYANAVGLAKELGIATGVGNNMFNPTSTISRQDMMVLVARALEIAGASLDKDTSVLDNFADADMIADYAKPYVAALVNAGIVSGTGNKIEATADITRAQMAVLLYNVAVASTLEEESVETSEEEFVEEETEISEEEAVEEETEASEEEAAEEETEASEEEAAEEAE